MATIVVDSAVVNEIESSLMGKLDSVDLYNIKCKIYKKIKRDSKSSVIKGKILGISAV